MQMGAIRQQQPRPLSQIDCLMQLKSGLNTWSQNDFNQGTCYTPVTQGTLGKSIFPNTPAPRKNGTEPLLERFFPNADVAFKSLDTSLHTANKLLGLVAEEVILWPEVLKHTEFRLLPSHSLS